MAKLKWSLALAGVMVALFAGCTPSADIQSRHQRTHSTVQAAALSQDGQLSFIASADDGLMLVRGDNELLYHWQQHAGGIAQIRDVAISADSEVVVAASPDSIALWNTRNGEVDGYWRTDESRIRAVAVSNRGQTIVLGRSDGVVVVFEPASGRRLEFFGHHERVNTLDISPNGRYVLSGSDDHTALLWDTQSGQVLNRFAMEARVTQVRLLQDGSRALTASGHEAVIWVPGSGERLSRLQLEARNKTFTSAAFSDDGRFLVTGSPSRHVELWDIESGRRLARWSVDGRPGENPPRASVLAVAFVGQSGELKTESSAGYGARWYIGNLFTQ